MPSHWCRRLLVIVSLLAAVGAQQPGPPPAAAPAAPPDPDAAVLAALQQFFVADRAAQAAFAFDAALDAELLTAAGDARLRALAFRAWRALPHDDLRRDFAAGEVRAGDRTSRYVVRQVGERPAGGWALVIAMHGGGGVKAEVNDQQWRVMQRYYRDHAEAGGYLYCALRAPTDDWNGFYTDYFYPLLERLIRQFVVAADVDPSRVFAIGYSHGGYGAFAVGPKLPHRFAAVHASAAAPTDGESSPIGLHSLPFSFMVGGRDVAYGRRERCERFAAELDALRQEFPGCYPTRFDLIEHNGHTGLPDRDLLPRLLAHTRNATPAALRWRLTDATVADHYWLGVATPRAGAMVTAKLDGNRLVATIDGEVQVTARLDARRCDPRQPLVVQVGAVAREVALVPRLATLCRTLQQSGDPALAASCEVALNPR